jgi:hypothetical protein
MTTRGYPGTWPAVPIELIDFFETYGLTEEIVCWLYLAFRRDHPEAGLRMGSVIPGTDGAPDHVVYVEDLYGDDTLITDIPGGPAAGVEYADDVPEDLEDGTQQVESVILSTAARGLRDVPNQGEQGATE